MTVTYNDKVFTSQSFAVLFRLLCKWRGSIYKLVWKDLILYSLCYALLTLIYRFALTASQKEIFEDFSVFCGRFGDLIPVTFVLGFYVSLVVTRWWAQFETIPWPDSSAVWISIIMADHDDRGRLLRRSIIRYMNLGLILTLRLISLPVKKRFPTLQHLVDAGFLMETEKQILERIEAKKVPNFWMPLIWAGGIVQTARREERIANDFMLKTLVDRIDAFRGACGSLLNYDWVNVPLVYTQVVTLAVYTWVLSTLMGRQFLDTSKKLPGHEVDLYVPIFTLLQLFFYLGWLKVAEALLNPFGEDDDDFECNWLIDRNIKVSFLIVDEMHNAHPELVRDQFWEDLYPELPYTVATEEEMAKVNDEIVLGTTAGVEIPEELHEFVNLNSVVEDNKNASQSQLSVHSGNALRRGTLFADVNMFRAGDMIIHEGNEDDDEDDETKIDATTKLLGGGSQKSGLNTELGLESARPPSNNKGRTLSVSSTFSAKSGTSKKSN